jgi:hypothetical protein
MGGFLMVAARRLVPVFFIALLALSPLFVLTPKVSAAQGGLVRKHYCPDGYDATNATIYDLAANCQIPGDGISFSASGPGGYSQSGVTDGNGWVSFSNVPVGQITVTEDVPPDTLVRAFCDVKDFQGQGGGYVEYGSQAVLQVDQDDNFDCDWYNVPPFDDEGTVYIRKHGCPEDYNAAIANIYDLAANCQDIQQGVDFKLEPSDGNPGNQLTDANGWVQWDNIKGGPGQIIETPPPDTFFIRVFCRQMKITGEDTGFSEYPASGFTVGYDHMLGYELDCDWFNSGYQGDESSVLIRKHGCPSDYDASSASIYDLAANCHDVQPDIDFKLEPFDGNPGNQLTDQSGQVTWNNISPGPGTIIETPPPGYVSIRVFCRQYKLTGEDTGFSEYSVNGFVASYDLQDGYSLDCDWFNTYSQPGQGPAPTSDGPSGTIVPNTTPGPYSTPSASGPASLTIIKYTCEPGYDVFRFDADPKVDCPETTAGIEIRSIGKTTTTPKTTGDDGKAVWTGLNSGPHFLQEVMPDDIEYAFILECTSNVQPFDSYPLYPFAIIGPDGKIGYTIYPGENLTCTWYDVPSETDGTPEALGDGNVTVIKRWCPGDTADPQSCPIYPDGISIRLNPADGNGDPVTKTTDENGVATFDVPAGTYTVQEPTGIDMCDADSDAFDADGNVVVGAEPVEVVIYNCGNQP